MASKAVTEALERLKLDDVAGIYTGTDSELAVSFVQTGLLPFDLIMSGGLAKGRISLMFGESQCVAPDTPVLRDDLRWVPAGDIAPGDHLVSFDEHHNGRGSPRRYKRGEVIDNTAFRTGCYRVITDKGDVVVSVDHRWLTRFGVPGVNAKLDWIHTGPTGDSRPSLRPGDRIWWLGEPWREDRSYEAGWLAGFYDGEGHVGLSASAASTGRPSGLRVRVGQVANVALERAEKYLAETGFQSVTRLHRDATDQWQAFYNVDIAGGFTEQLRFLGTVRPERLINNARWEGLSLTVRGPNATRDPFATVQAVEWVGDQEVVPLTNTARTFFANGMASHNTFKSYLMMHTAKSALAQADAAGRPNAIAIIVDAERAYDPKWAKRIGVPLDRIIVLREQIGEAMVDTVTALLQDPETFVEFLGWDSLAATLTQEMAAKTATEVDRVGTTARFAHRMFRRLGPLLDWKDEETGRLHQCAFLMLNQTYTNITGYGGDAQAGGKAVNFYPTQRFKVTRVHSEAKAKPLWRHGKRSDLKVSDQEDFMIIVDKDRTQYRPDPVGFSWLVKEACVDQLDVALNHGLNVGVIESLDKERFRWTHPDGTAYEAAAYWRMRNKLIAAPPEHQQDLMEAVLKASIPSLVTS